MASPPGTPPRLKSPEKSLELTDLPVKFLNKVIDELDVQDWLIVRNVSHGFRKLIDDLEVDISKVTVHMNREDTEIHIEDQIILYPFRITRIAPVPYLPNMKTVMTFLMNCKIRQFEVKTESVPGVIAQYVDPRKTSALKICKKIFYSTEHPDLMIRILQNLNLDRIAVLEPIKGMEQRETKMTDHLKIIIDKYIYNCAIAKYRVYHSYGLLSKILGHFKLPFVEFEWKYYQHYHGNSDLSIWKRSEEMSSLPEKMKESFKHVMKKLDIIDRIILRKASREMRKLVDTANFHCDEVVLHFEKEICFIQINNWKMFYDQEGSVSYCNDCDDGYEISINVSKKFASDSRKRLDMMCDDAETFLKNPNLTIGTLKIHIEFQFHDAANCLIAMLKSLNNQIHVERIEMYEDTEDGTVSAIVPIIKILNPETLREIDLDCGIKEMEPWRKIQATEQWKKAEIFELDYLLNEFPIEELSHFKQIFCSSMEVGPERLVEIRDILIKSAHFENLHINEPTLRDLSPEKIARIMREDPTFSTKLGGFLIPNSKDYLRLYMGDETKEYEDDDGRENFGIERIAIEEDSVDSKVENDYPDATAISKFILKAALKKEEVFESYKEWDENEENPKIDFLDFEWRFYKFYRGERDLSIEKSSESSVTFYDLPNIVLEKIMKTTDWLDRQVIRKVCPNLRKIVDKTNVYCKEVLLHFGTNQMLFRWENEQIKYLRAGDEDEFGYEVPRDGRFEETKTKELNLSKEEFAQLMTSDATAFLKTPNLKIGKFTIHAAYDHFPHLSSIVVRFLKSLEFKICTEELNLAYNSPFHEILQYFDSNCLKKLCLNDKMRSWKKLEKNTASNEVDQAQNGLKKMIEMEIWTNIEIFKMDFHLADDFPIEKLFHFKHIKIESMVLTEKRLVMIRDNLLKSKQFESACFYIVRKKELTKKKVNRWEFIDGILSQDAAYDSGTHRFSILHSQEYYQLNFGVPCCEPDKLYIRKTLENENSDESDKNGDDHHHSARFMGI